MKINLKHILTVASFTAVVFTGCKKFDNPPPVFEDAQTVSSVQRKVLIISIDGVTGSELKTIAPTNIEALRNTSKYTFDVMRGAVSNDVASWASMLNGVSYSKHLIKTTDFLPSPKENSHNAPDVFRHLFDYILQYKSLKTAIVSPWNNLRDYLKVADISPVVSTDVAVKDSTVSILGKETTLGTIVVNFKDAQTAGANGGYVATNANYKTAIEKSDEYVGNIITALKARKNYANEDWLVIVTSNHGGSDLDPQPGFLVVSQKDLKKAELVPGYNTVRFNPSTINAEAPNTNGLYDGGSTKDFTVQMDVKFNGTTYYPGFLSKGTNLIGGSITGWLWMLAGGEWGVVFGGTNNGGNGKTQIKGGLGMNDNAWHTLTMVIKTVGTTDRTMTTYVDGVQTGSGSLFGTKNLTTSEMLRVGYRNVDNGGTALDLYASNLAYYNVALDAATVKANVNLTDITKHPNYANLIGFWPMNDRFGAKFANKAPGGFDMNLNGSYNWTDLGNNTPLSVPKIEGTPVTVNSQSVTALSLYWMKINILPEFNIDGNPFLKQFELEFLKK